MPVPNVTRSFPWAETNKHDLLVLMDYEKYFEEV